MVSCPADGVNERDRRKCDVRGFGTPRCAIHSDRRISATDLSRSSTQNLRAGFLDLRIQRAGDLDRRQRHRR